MFRILCDPSSEGTELCLTEITLSDSQIFFVCLIGVWQRNFELALCVCTVRRAGNQPVVPCTHTHRKFKITLPNTDQAHEKYL